jgi:hypothetical protein
MRNRVTIAALFVAMTLAGTPAHACIMMVPIELTDIEYADVVVVGRIDHYERVGNEELISGYAKFDVLVDEVLLGDAPQEITVTWDNSTFTEPETMAPGPFVIALRDPGSRMPPLRSSGSIFPNPKPDLLTLLQAPCSSPFMFASGSEEAKAIRQMLHR